MPANNEIWILGDSFMTMAAQHLEFWKAAMRKDPHEALYMLHWYDVKAVVPHSTSSNAVELITSSLVDILNTRPKLPQKLIVVLGDIKFWCDNDALDFTMDYILMGLLKEIKRIIQMRQEDLPAKAVGDDPQIYMVKLHWKPEKAIDTVPMYPKKRRTFNRLVDNTMHPRGVKTISLNEITVKVDDNFFLAHGSLSELGYRQVWKSLSEALCDFDTLGYQKPVDFVPKAGLLREAAPPQYTSNDSDNEIETFNVNNRRTKMKKRRFNNKHHGQHKRRFNTDTHYSAEQYFHF